MSSVTQIAFRLDNDSLGALDRLAASLAQPRAEVLRIAVREFLHRQREDQIDAEIAAAYGAAPPGAEEEAFAATSVEGFKAAHLDW